MKQASKWTWLVSLVVLATLLTPTAFGETRTNAPAQSPPAQADAADTRRDSVLKGALARKFRDHMSMRQLVPLALARYWLNQDTAAADQAIIRFASRPAKTTEIYKAGSYFLIDSYLLQRVYFLFNSRSGYSPGRMSKEAEDAVAKYIWDRASVSCKKKMVLPEHVWWLGGTENLAGRKWACLWGAAQILATHPDYRDRTYEDGTSVQEMAQAFDDYYKLFIRERASKGLLVEVNSGYNGWTLNAWYNIADFSRDPIARQRMKMFLDLYWADWAIEQIDGVRGGSRQRCYPGGSSTKGSGGGGAAAWFLFGAGDPVKNLQPSSFGPATTFYRPSRIVTELLSAAERGTYAYVSRRPGRGTNTYLHKNQADPDDQNAGLPKPRDTYDAFVLAPEGGDLLRYTFCTPDFVMGTSMVPALPLEDWTLISSQNHWEGVIFAGNHTARIFVQPEAADGKHYYNASWSLQNKGAMIMQRLRTSKKARGQRIWFDASLKRSERDGWVFAEAPQAYAAVRVVAGGSNWEADLPKVGQPGNGMWLRCQNDYAPIIIEVARQSAYPDFAAFQKTILANALSWNNKKLDYHSGFYQTQLTFFADYSKPPQVDGVPVNYAPKKVYDSPFIESDFGRGVVTLRKGDRKLVLNFNNGRDSNP